MFLSAVLPHPSLLKKDTHLFEKILLDWKVHFSILLLKIAVTSMLYTKISLLTMELLESTIKQNRYLG